MKISGQLRFIVINKQANSLYSLIADGTYRATSLGRNEWKKLIGAEGSLQLNCNKEGFNAVGSLSDLSKARIGYIANNENHCDSCNSRIGFGTGGSPNTPLRMETQLLIPQITVTEISKLWDIFWCSKLFQSMYDLSKLTKNGGGEVGF